jgi:hypothetical protein
MFFFLSFISAGRGRRHGVRFLSLYFCRVDVGVDVEAMNNGAVVLLIGFTPVESQRSGARASPEK